MPLPDRCIQIGTTIVQGPCLIETVHNHHTGEQEPTGRGTIDGITGKLIVQQRGKFDCPHQPGCGCPGGSEMPGCPAQQRAGA